MDLLFFQIRKMSDSNLDGNDDAVSEATVRNSIEYLRKQNRNDFASEVEKLLENAKDQPSGKVIV